MGKQYLFIVLGMWFIFVNYLVFHHDDGSTLGKRHPGQMTRDWSSESPEMYLPMSPTRGYMLIINLSRTVTSYKHLCTVTWCCDVTRDCSHHRVRAVLV